MSAVAPRKWGMSSFPRHARPVQLSFEVGVGAVGGKVAGGGEEGVCIEGAVSPAVLFLEESRESRRLRFSPSSSSSCPPKCTVIRHTDLHPREVLR